MKTLGEEIPNEQSQSELLDQANKVLAFWKQKKHARLLRLTLLNWREKHSISDIWQPEIISTEIEEVFYHSRTMCDVIFHLKAELINSSYKMRFIKQEAAYLAGENGTWLYDPRSVQLVRF